MEENDLRMHTKQKETLIIKSTNFWGVNVAIKGRRLLAEDTRQ
jgi:hypothetical protein